MLTNSIRTGICLAAVALAGDTAWIIASKSIVKAQTGPPAPVLSGYLPSTVKVPPNLTPPQMQPFFDYFSWESLIALAWPVLSGQNGVANQPTNSSVFLQAPNGADLVWTTYKNSFALFGQGNNRPPEWQSSVMPINPCTQAKPDARLLVMAAKGGELINAPPNEAFSVPLIDQNRNYVYFEILFNKDQYNFVRGPDTGGLYLVKNLAAAEPVIMPARSLSYPVSSLQGSIMLKAAWRIMTAKDQGCTSNPAGAGCRYYVVQAQVYNPNDKTCSTQPMGLVGLHVVQKLASFPEWIWSTFEQVDNVQRGPGATAQTPISFNNGTNNPVTIGGWANRPANTVPPLLPQSQRIPTQVTRYNPILASTADLNVTFQKALAGTVWRNYQLVFTQWPTLPSQFQYAENGGVYPAGSGSPFPVNGVTNTSAETYFQSASDAAGAGGNSCMSCHYRAAQADFSWSLMRGAH